MNSPLATCLVLLSLTLSLAARPRASQVGQPDPPAITVTYQEFVADLRKAAANPKLTEKQLNQFYSKYSDLLAGRTDVGRLRSALQELPPAPEFPPAPLVQEPFYRSTLELMLRSKNANHRLLAYAVLGADGDTRYNERLLTVVRQEKNKEARIWAGVALLFLNDPHTDQLFDFVVANEDWRDPHLAAFYLQRDPESLFQVAKQKIHSKNPQARILALQSFVRDNLDPECQSILREAVKTWKPDIRGYAIYVLAKNHTPQLKELLAPSLGDKQLRSICITALAASPTPEDQEFLATQPVDESLLDAYLESESAAGTRKWLSLLEQGPPAQYRFFVSQHPLLKSDELLPDVQHTLKRLKDPEAIHSLVQALDGRQDEASLDILLGLLRHPDETVRYWAADSLKPVVSPKVAQVLPDLIRNPELRTSALTELAINNRVDSLRDVYRSFWIPKPSDDRDWRRCSLEYLAAFPKSEDLDLLRGVAANDPDVFSRRTAIEALGILADTGSVELVQAALAKEPAADANAVDYLEALGRIGGPAAQAILERYKDSRHPEVRALVRKYLKQ